MRVCRAQFYLRNTNGVNALEIIRAKVNLKKSFMVDKEIEEYLTNKE